MTWISFNTSRGLACFAMWVAAASMLNAQSATQSSATQNTSPIQNSQFTITPPLIDFGVVKPRSQQQGKFIIHNGSTKTVRIESAFPSCKCTTLSDLANKEIPAGGDIELVASLDAPGTPGEKDAKVFVTFAGNGQPLIARMKGLVQFPLLVDPAFIDALKGKTRGVVEISSPNKAPFHILSCDGAAPQFVDFDPAKDPARARYLVRWDFSMVPEGKLQQWWCVETDVKDCPILPFRIRHESTGVRFDPKMDERRWFITESIVLPDRLTLDKPVDLEVEIESTIGRGKPQPAGWDAVRAVASINPAFTAQMISSKRVGDRVHVVFRFTVVKSSGGFVYAPLEISTDTGSARFFVAATVAP